MTDLLVTNEVAPAPSALAPWYAAVEQSRYFLAWADDWDDEGSPAYDEAVWRRATDFVLHTATTVFQRYGVLVPAPRILPGLDGSIDIHWRGGLREMLLNIPPANAADLPSFFGDDRKGTELRGQLNLNEDAV